MTGLRVWLHPSSRTIRRDVTCYVSLPTRSGAALDVTLTNIRGTARRDVASNVSTKSNSAAFWRTAAVVRNRRDVANGAHFNSRGTQRSHRRLAAGTGAADADIHAADAVIARQVGGVRGGLLRGEGRALTRSAESERS